MLYTCGYTYNISCCVLLLLLCLGSSRQQYDKDVTTSIVNWIGQLQAIIMETQRL